jgi:hypothetical protein
MTVGSVPKQALMVKLVSNVKLVSRLMLDKRVNIFSKLLPVAGIVYLIWPDFIFGPFDDASIIYLAFYTFLKLNPVKLINP